MTTFTRGIPPEGYHQIKSFKPHGRTMGFIAIHNTNLGPALGGTRIFPYKNSEEAIQDALRLSKAMTYKCAIAGVPFGGGKGVIMASPGRKNIKEILKAYAKTVNELGGVFHTGEDVGLSEEHVQYMLKFSPFFIGKSHLAGDPSPFAAQSAFLCVKVACGQVFGSKELAGKTVFVKGVGKTGRALAKLLASEGAKVFVTDRNPRAVNSLLKECPLIRTTGARDIADIKVDIYAPCALGQDIHTSNIKKVKAKLIVGTANNQLQDMRAAEQLFRYGILHVPDYIANAGGLINVADELLPGGYNPKRVERNIAKLQETLREVLTASAKKKTNPDAIANEMAEKIFMKKIMAPQKIAVNF